MQFPYINSPAALFWGVVRMILGIAQMTGAIVSATSLFRIGVAREALIAAGATLACTGVSLILFKWLKVHERRIH